ncbi:MAG: MFS transporter [Betaproteobacteria bacterium]|nr:MFS transporter [Betaproteobacteria bacterium]
MFDIQKTGTGFGSTFGESISLLKTRRFGTFWFASFLSNIGTWAQQVAQPWLLLSLGASPFLLGLDVFALGAPIWFLTLAGGILADRADRRRVIATFQSIQMLCPTLLVVLLLTGAVSPWMVITLSLVIGITDALSMPSFQTIVSTIVKHDQIAAGLALNSTQFNLSRILGPAIAGVLLVSVGAVGCFAISAVSYLPFIFVALWILPRQNIRTNARDVFDRRHPFAGLLEVIRMPNLRGGLMTVFASSILCGPLITFCPVLVKNMLQGNAMQFSIAISSFGVGALVGAIVLLLIDTHSDRRMIGSVFAVSFGITLAFVAINPWFWALPILMALAGLSMSITNISVNTLLQTQSPAQLRGQAVSLFMLAMRGGISLGGLLTGVTVSLLGVDHALLINGILAVAVQLFIAWSWLNNNVLNHNN